MASSEAKGGAPILGAPSARGRAFARMGLTPTLGRVSATLIGLAALDAIAIWFVYGLALNGAIPMAIGFLVLTALANWIFLSDRLYPLRWLVPGLFFMFVFAVYPVVSTVFVAFTNYGQGHLLTKAQVIAQFEEQFYSPPDAPTYGWTAYRSSDGRYLLWLTDEAGRSFLAEPGKGVSPVTEGDSRFGPRGADGLPERIGAYERLSRIDAVRHLGELGALRIRDGDGEIRIVSLDAAPRAKQKYTFDSQRDVLVDNESGAIYRPVEGTFVAGDGRALSPGFTSVIGVENFERIAADPDIQGPFARVFAWTFAFALLTVLLVFSAGLAVALVMNDERLPLRGVWRSIAILPYTIPGFISMLVWVGLMNPLYGPFNLALKDLVGVSPEWFADPTLAKAAILLVNLWLGYPYMLLICLGALQSIPSELYEAAQIDGASAFQRFRTVTLPLLLVSVGPLLIGTFAFNFNNFTLIDLITQGGPAMSAATPAGHTDILISYTFRLSFASGTGSQYGVAAAISILIFAITAGITALNFRLTRSWEQVSENL